MQDDSLLIPRWPAPAGVRALSTLRNGGVSQGPWKSFNLAGHVGDRAVDVALNRKRLTEIAALPGDPVWMDQVHGTAVIDPARRQAACEADAQTTDQQGVICLVLTADCLPLLICNKSGTRVAAVHAGWRGLAAGVIESTLEYFTDSGQDIMVWLGPAIGPQVFEVGDEVRRAFVQADAAAQEAFLPGLQGRWLADIYMLARLRLAARGVREVFGGEWCTYSDTGRFFSYRRDGTTGRMASLIWLD